MYTNGRINAPSITLRTDCQSQLNVSPHVQMYMIKTQMLKRNLVIKDKLTKLLTSLQYNYKIKSLNPIAIIRVMYLYIQTALSKQMI